ARWSPGALRMAGARSAAAGLAGRERRGGGLAFAAPLAGAFAATLPAGLLGRVMAERGLSAESSAQYCSSESLSHPELGQSSSSSRLPRCRDLLLLLAGAGAALRRGSGRSLESSTAW